MKEVFKESVFSEFNGLIEGNYRFAGYEGNVRLFVGHKRKKGSITKHYRIEARLKALATDYIYVSRPEFEIFGQHPYLQDDGTLFINNNDRWTNRGNLLDKHFLQTGKYASGLENLDILLLMDAFWPDMIFNLLDDSFLYEKVAYTLNGNMSQLDNPIIFDYSNPTHLSNIEKFEFENRQRCIIEFGYGVDYGHIYICSYNESWFVFQDSKLAKDSNVKAVADFIKASKRPEIIYPY